MNQNGTKIIELNSWRRWFSVIASITYPSLSWQFSVIYFFGCRISQRQHFVVRHQVRNLLASRKRYQDNLLLRRSSPRTRWVQRRPHTAVHCAQCHLANHQRGSHFWLRQGDSPPCSFSLALKLVSPNLIRWLVIEQLGKKQLTSVQN